MSFPMQIGLSFFTSMLGAIGGGGGGTDGFSAADITRMRAEDRQLLALQMAVQEETKRFNLESNLAKAEFDAALAAIRNIRAN